MKKTTKIFIIGIPVVIILSILILGITLSFTPTPLFKIADIVPIEANLTKPDNYSSIDRNTRVEKNIIYSQNYSNSSLDIYSPKKSNGKVPAVLFIHGGGFFKGEKEMAKYFGPTISDNQYAFISINYDLVPNVTVFDQVKQINEAIKYIKENADKYSLDINNINLSGSSAGGFLALQLLTAYCDKDYAESLKVTPVGTIKFNSILLYSAVYDLSEFQTFDGNSFTNYLLTKMGWGLTGEKNWKTDKKLGELLNLNNYVSGDFPPIFITDGNTNTFTEQAENYDNELRQKQVSVQTLFFDSKEKVGHGYQLKMDTSASKQAVKESLEFLNKWN